MASSDVFRRSAWGVLAAKAAALGVAAAAVDARPQLQPLQQSAARVDGREETAQATGSIVGHLEPLLKVPEKPALVQLQRHMMTQQRRLLQLGGITATVLLKGLFPLELGCCYASQAH